MEQGDKEKQQERIAYLVSRGHKRDIAISMLWDVHIRDMVDRLLKKQEDRCPKKLQ